MITMTRAIIYKPRESFGKNLAVAFRDYFAGDKESNWYELSLRSLFLPEIAVLGRFTWGKNEGYSLDTNFFRYSRNPADLQCVQSLIEQGDCEVIKEFEMPDYLAAQTLEAFSRYAEKIKVRDEAIKSEQNAREEIRSKSQAITNACFARIDLDRKSCFPYAQ